MKGITITVIVITIIIIILLCRKKMEGFNSYLNYYKKYCGSCGKRTRYSCGKCYNCGYCITPSGYGECTPGDSSGPYFRRDCMYWEYGDPYYYYPYSHVYPVIKTKSIYPRYRWNRNKKYRGKPRFDRKIRPDTKSGPFVIKK